MPVQTWRTASTNATPCDQGSITVQNLYLRLFDTGLADPNDFFTLVGGNTPDIDPVHSTYFTFPVGGLAVTNVRVEDLQVVGFDILTPSVGQTVVLYSSNLYSFPSSAGGNLFRLTFDTDGPILECLNCRQDINDPSGTEDVLADTAGLTQFLITYTSDDTSVPKFTDPNTGQALGASLDSSGDYLGRFTTPQQAVPEPGTLALALAALTAVGWSRRRRV